MFPRLFLIIIFLFTLLFSSSSVTLATSQNLEVSCFGSEEIDDCVISPLDGKLFDEHNVLPGDTFTQSIDVTNFTSQTLNAFWDAHTQLPSSTPNLADIVLIEIRKDSGNGDVVMSERTLSELLTSTFIPLSPISPLQTQRYVVQARINPQAGNFYQGSSTVFDVLVNMQLSTTPIVTPTPNTFSTTAFASSQVAGSTTSNPPECSDVAPSSAPILTSPTAVGANGQLTLTWTPVSPVTTYAINFGVQPGVYLFGNTNIGNSTSYTVTGLTSGNQYYFQVLGVNGCAPGPRSNEVFTQGQPVVTPVLSPPGFTPGEVLGESTEILPSSSLFPTPPPIQSFILGAETASFINQCKETNWWLAIILLLIQSIAIVGGQFLVAQSIWKRKIVLSGSLTLLSIYLFYVLSACNCEEGSLLFWLCRLYWLVSVGLTGVIYLLIPHLPITKISDPDPTK